MNREEAIYFANCLKNNYTVDLNDMEAFCDMAIKALAQEPTTKNDLPHCQHTDEEIAKSFIEDVEAVKDQLPCFCEQMDFPNTFDEFAEDYGFKDEKEIYTNGSELIPVFRVKQWLEHISTTKNDLGVDCISRQAVIDGIKEYFHDEYYQRTSIQDCRDCFIEDVLNHLPTVTPQELRWIPASERLPEKNMECLVAVGKFNLTKMAMYSDLMGTIDHKIFYQGDVRHDNFEDITEYVKAWMPLPQPYREVEE